MRPIFDSDLTAGEGIPMIRQEVRWNAVNLLGYVRKKLFMISVQETAQ